MCAVIVYAMVLSSEDELCRTGRLPATRFKSPLGT